METIFFDVISYIIICIIIFIFVCKLYMTYVTKMCRCETKLTGKIAIVTGANTGIGFQTARNLAKRHAKVILACRDKTKGTRAVNMIRRETRNSYVYFKQLDLESFTSVTRFAQEILDSLPFVHILINNAGTGMLDHSLTEDNLPIEVQVNHYSPFLLTLLLLPLLQKEPNSRIINVSSVMHKIGRVDPENFHKQRKTFLDRRRVYADTKLANMLFTLKLSELLKGTYVTVNCLHPGGVYTDFFRHQPFIVKFILRFCMKTAWEGAQTVIHLAVAPELAHTSGKYFVECKKASPAKRALDKSVAHRLWLNSEKIVEPYLPADNY
ncbi:retinol dehydrogenase 12-like [Amyelois transitella]|uniref:retinol dehydrogenase 12-like n=1 Tax=Amyelois transitella TaxID=680683 RepID=UPI0029907C84|nr:retinol dehydrogenase 12-like [Amyelois transitella]